MEQMTISEIKTRAKSLFTKCWAEAAFITVLQTGIVMLYYAVMIFLGRLTGVHVSNTFMPEFISFPPPFVLSSAVLILAGHTITAPLSFGIKWYYWQVSSGMFVPVSSIFVCYSSVDSIKRCVKIQALIDFREAGMLAVAAVLSIPPYMLMNMLHGMTEEGSLAYIFITAGFISAEIIIFIAFICASLVHIPLGYIMADDPDASVSDVIAAGRKNLFGKYKGIISLYFSFWIWYGLCILAFPLLPLIPYLYMSTAVYIRSKKQIVNNDGSREYQEAIISG